VTAAALALLLVPAPALAQDCPKTTLGDIEDEVMCPICGTPLGLASEAPQAQQQRAFIEEQIAACRSKEEIKSALVAQFGEGVLALPGDESGEDDLGDVLVYAIAAGRARGRAPPRRPAPTPPGSTPTSSATTSNRMIAATDVDATVFAAFAVGFVSFISPCVLPLVPGYLSTISGVSFADLQEGRGKAKVLGPALLFCLAFTAMFIALGMTATGLGQTLNDNRQLLREIAGVVIALMGVLFISTLFVPLLNREWRPEQLMRRAHTGGPIVAGLAFAVAWLPCTGPTLGAILTAASTESTVGEGGVLLAFYALGLAVPFILSALAFSTFSGLFRFFRDHYRVITVVSGVVLVVMGVLLYANELTRLNDDALRVMENLGINFFNEI
jgi:cytochrome c-type biogenesis protein